MSRIMAVATSVPPNKVSQAQAKEVASRIYRGQSELERLLRVFDRTGVETRYFVHPIEYYAEERSFEERNLEFRDRGVDLAGAAVKDCLSKAKVGAAQIDHLIFVTTTGLATPSLDALLCNRLGFKPEVKRTPIFGLGCAGGVAALARAHDLCKAHPKHRVLVVSLEVCSMVWSTMARTPVDLVGAALFGDGAVAILLGGDEIAPQGPKILTSKSVLFPGTEDLMGWKFTSDGMRLVLSQDVPDLVTRELRPAVEKMVLEFALSLGKIRHYILHPGGPKVMDAYLDAFELDPGTLQPTRDSMRRHGNLSSAAVLFVLNDLIAGGRVKPGEKGVMVALGPGFAAEMLLLSW